MQRTWLVTGSARGLGRHIVRAAAEAGDLVLATARTIDHLADLRSAHADRVIAHPLDVTDREQCRATVDLAVERFGRIDVLVNNAGQADLGSVEDTPDDRFWAQHAVSYAGVVHLTRAALPVFRRQRSGHLIQISSLGARLGTPGLASYQAAKAATTVFSLSLAAEVAPLGIHITIVEPGNLRTDMTSPRSMTILPISEAYRPTVGTNAERLRQQNGHQPGDPAKAARAIVEISNMEPPPLRLLLGSDAIRLAHTAAQRLADEDSRWQELSTAIDVDD
jgi:NAD(P)-dependent dehydrogenase (short-subunit alcohol dehydrogenase family)